MSFMAGAWLHESPPRECGANDKMAIIQHLCFGPLETRIWYARKDGQYCREVHFIEGTQAGEVYTDFLRKSEMLEAVKAELALCEKYHDMEAVGFLTAEKEKLENGNP